MTELTKVVKRAALMVLLTVDPTAGVSAELKAGHWVAQSAGTTGALKAASSAVRSGWSVEMSADSSAA